MTNEEIAGNLASMSELAHAHNIGVVLASVTPVSAYHVASPAAVPQTTLRPMARIQALNDWLKTHVAAHGDVYLDYFSAMTDRSGLLGAELSEDDLHPYAKGYAIMAPLAEAAIAGRNRVVTGTGSPSCLMCADSKSASESAAISDVPSSRYSNPAVLAASMSFKGVHRPT